MAECRDRWRWLDKQRHASPVHMCNQSLPGTPPARPGPHQVEGHSGVGGADAEAEQDAANHQHGQVVRAGVQAGAQQEAQGGEEHAALQRRRMGQRECSSEAL